MGLNIPSFPIICRARIAQDREDDEHGGDLPHSVPVDILKQVLKICIRGDNHERRLRTRYHALLNSTRQGAHEVFGCRNRMKVVHDIERGLQPVGPKLAEGVAKTECSVWPRQDLA